MTLTRKILLTIAAIAIPVGAVIVVLVIVARVFERVG